MTQVFRSLELQWQGKSYTLSPSLDLLRRVDGELKRYDRQNGATQLALALLRGGVEPADCAVAWSMFARQAGINITPDDCYRAIIASSNDPAIAEDAASFQIAFVQAVLPDVDLGKKPDALANPPKARATRKASK
jgi:hypothetical protein